MEEYLLEEFERKGYAIKFFSDIDPENPRKWENLGTMVCFHRRYSLGDTHEFTTESVQYYIKRPDVVALPLFLYDHGGLSMSVRSFHGRAPHAEWDSGQVGFIFVIKGDIRENWGDRRRVTKKYRDHALAILKSEVETYNQYLRGEVYGYQVEDPNGEVVESCWGYHGNDWEKDVLPELKRFVDHECKATEEMNALAHQEEIEGTLAGHFVGMALHY